MKVLFVQNIEGVAGSEKYFLALIPKLIEKGVICEIFCVHPINKKDEALKFYELLKEHNIPYKVLEVQKYYSLKIIKELNNYYKINNFDLLHSHLIYADYWCALLKIFLNKKAKVISTKHGYHEKTYVKFCNKPAGIPKNIYYYLFKFTHKFIDKSFACSYGLRDFYLKANLIKPNTMDVIQHGFDYPEIENFDNANYRFGKNQIVVVGRLIERKGHALLIQIMPNLLHKFPDLVLIIVGSGELESDLKSLAKELKIEKSIYFLGFQKDVEKYLNSSDIAVFPSYSEGLPLVVFEAFNAKVPVVSFDSIGCDELIENGINGLKAKSFDTDDLELKIETLLIDKSLGRIFIENSFDKLHSYFTLDRMANDTIRIYENLFVLN